MAAIQEFQNITLLDAGRESHSPGTPSLMRLFVQPAVRAARRIMKAIRGTSSATALGAPHLFISYARKDDERFVQRLHHDLTKLGFVVWWDREAMQSRERTFLQEIRDALEGSDRVIAVIGPNAVASRFVRYEWEYAKVFSKGVVPILRQGSDDLVPSELARFHRPDFRNDRRYSEAFGELVRILKVPVPPLGPFRATPPLPPHFILRRDDISAIVQIITADVLRPIVVPPAQQIAAVVGMPGSGKSVLAAAVARATDTRRSFADGAIWVRIGQAPDVLQKLQEIRAAFNETAPPSETLDIARARLQEVLQHKTCLLVMDDVWRVSDVEPFQGALGPLCRMVITSRDATIATSLGAHARPIGVVSDEEAAALLAAWTGDRFDVTASRRVSAEVGNLPLALALCGATVRDGVSWNDLIEALHNADLAFIDREFPSYPYTGVFKSLQVSLDFLDRSDPVAAKLYRQLSALPLERGIPERVALTMWRHDSDLSEREARLILVKLERRAFIKLEGKEPGRRITAHSLQHDYLCKVVRDLKPFHDRLLQAYRAKAANWSRTPDDGYFYEHAARHFVGAGREAELYALIEDSQWFAVKRSLDPSLYSYIEDVRTALQSAAQLENPDIPRLIAYTWLLTLLKGINKGVPFEAIESMVLLGKTDQALRNAEMIDDLNIYFWTQRRIVGLLASRSTSRSKEVGERMLDRVANLDDDLKRELSREIPPLNEVVNILVSRHQAQRSTTLRTLLQHYGVQPESVLDPDREFVLLAPMEHEIDLNQWSVALGALTKWWITEVDFPEAAQPEPTERETQMFGMLPLLSSTLGAQRFDRQLLRAAVAEVLAEIGDATRALLLASDLDNALSRLNVMALSLAAFVRDQDANTVDLLWSQLAETSTEKYAGATPDRVRILIRVTDATMHTVRAIQAIQKAHGLTTHPGLVEAMDAGRPIDETLIRELAIRRAHDELAESMFSGGKGSPLIVAQCLLAEKTAHDISLFNDPRTEQLRKTAEDLVEGSKSRLKDEMEDVDRVTAMCAVARGMHALGQVAQSQTLLKQAESVAVGLKLDARVRAIATLAATFARLGDKPRAEEFLELALHQLGGVVDRTFVSEFHRAWVKALIASGNTERALEMTRTVSDVNARQTLMSEVASSLSVLGSTALAAEIADEIHIQLTSEGSTKPDFTVLANVAVAFAVAGRTESARELVDRAVAAAPMEPESARIDALIKIVERLAAAALLDLTFDLCRNTENVGTRAILFAALVRQVAAVEQTNDEQFANLYVWAISTAANAGSLYHCAIALLIAAGALERRGNRAAVVPLIQQQLRNVAGQAFSAEDCEALEKSVVAVDRLTAMALSMLASVGRRDGTIGTLRVVNAQRIAAGLDQIPLQALRETSPNHVWQIIRSEAMKAVANREATEALLERVLEMNRSHDTEWLTHDLDRIVKSLVDQKVADVTWDRIQKVAMLLEEAPASTAVV